ncbi:MAG: exopolysaccharide biosynthesis protein [Rhodospirillales bacterium]|nr:exopolysaccharide biosynthesis protein [Rhodospirillales bacterium]
MTRALSEPDATATDVLAAGQPRATDGGEDLEPLNGLSASVALTRLANEVGPERITFDHIIARLQDRAFGIVMIILAVPNCLPMPPGGSTVFGVALMLVALQMMLGRHELWLPPVLRRRSLARSDFQKVVARLAPLLARMERLCRPRATWIATGPFERLAGFVAFVLAFVVSLPIPIIGNMPPAVVIAVLSISMIERDGLAVIVALVLAIAVVALNFGVITAAVLAAIHALGALFGIQAI